jgi:hypothetical protein
MPWRGGTISVTMALSLSPLIRFGTSPWTYQGWQGQVYIRQYHENKFVQECLGEYCQDEYQGEPLFRTVGNDATFYRPPTANQLRRYLSQIPEDFQMSLRCGRRSPFRATQSSLGMEPERVSRTHGFSMLNCSMSWC